MRLRLERTTVLGYDRGAAARVSKEVRFQEFWKSISISQPKRAHSAERVDYVQQVYQHISKLSETDTKILKAIEKRFSWTEVATEDADIYTLTALTAETGDEFAMFARGNVKVVLHGASANGMPWKLPEDLARRVLDEQLLWEGHSLRRRWIKQRGRKILSAFSYRGRLAQFARKEQKIYLDNLVMN